MSFRRSVKKALRKREDYEPIFKTRSVRPDSEASFDKPRPSPYDTSKFRALISSDQPDLPHHLHTPSINGDGDFSVDFKQSELIVDAAIGASIDNAVQPKDPQVLWTAAAIYEFDTVAVAHEAGFPYLSYITGAIFDVFGERGELWLARNQDDPKRQIGWIWCIHFKKLLENTIPVTLVTSLPPRHFDGSIQEAQRRNYEQKQEVQSLPLSPLQSRQAAPPPVESGQEILNDLVLSQTPEHSKRDQPEHAQSLVPINESVVNGSDTLNHKVQKELAYLRRVRRGRKVVEQDLNQYAQLREADVRLQRKRSQRAGFTSDDQTSEPESTNAAIVEQSESNSTLQAQQDVTSDRLEDGKARADFVGQPGITDPGQTAMSKSVLEGWRVEQDTNQQTQEMVKSTQDGSTGVDIILGWEWPKLGNEKSDHGNIAKWETHHQDTRDHLAAAQSTQLPLISLDPEALQLKTTNSDDSDVLSSTEVPEEQSHALSSPLAAPSNASIPLPDPQRSVTAAWTMPRDMSNDSEAMPFSSPDSEIDVVDPQHILVSLVNSLETLSHKPEVLGKTYNSVHIQGQATAIVGDNYGPFIQHVHYHEQIKATAINAKYTTRIERQNVVLDSHTLETITVFQDGGPFRNRGTSSTTTIQWLRAEDLGAGIFGEVHREYQEQDKDIPKSRAVKVIRRRQLIRLQIDYKRELSALMRLSRDDYSQYFVEFYTWYESNNNIYIAMEYIAYGDLSRYVAEGFSPADLQAIASQIAEGLSVLHRLDIVHRDIKPENIFVAAKIPWWIKIGDFGICKNTITRNTALHTNVGTNGYQAPEVLGLVSRRKSNEYDCKCDIWSFGCLVSEMCTGEVPFPDVGSLADYCRLDNQNRQEYAFAGWSQDRSISGTLLKCIRKMLEPDPLNRYDAEEILRAFES